MQDKISVAVIGCGHWGKNLVRNFFELGVLVAVCDEDEAVAQNLANSHQLACLSVEAILVDSSIQGVVIAVPAAEHSILAERALRAGKHVFVEKPLALKAKDAQKLYALSKEKELILMVGHLLQYHPAFLELKRLVAEGDLGRLQYLYSNRLNLGKFRDQENILWSFAPHDISMILGLVAELPDSVYATGICQLNPNIQDVTTTHLAFRNGVQAHIFVSWLHPFKDQKLVVVGDRGMAVFDDGLPWAEKLQLYPHKINWLNGSPQPTKAEAVCVPLEASEPLNLECQHFIECMQSGITPKTDGLEGLQVLRVLEAAQESLRTQKATVLNRAVESELPYYKHDTAYVDKGCEIGAGTKIWHFSHILEGAKLGEQCIIGQNVMIGPDVSVGNFCKIQNNVSLYTGVVLEDGVFCGPSCVFTNVYNPRAQVERKHEFRKTWVEKGATIGANATIVCGVTLGAYSFIGAGAVVTKDVKPYALMVGNPAKQIGWMSQAGEKLEEDLTCPREGKCYRVSHEGFLQEVSSTTRVSVFSNAI